MKPVLCVKHRDGWCALAPDAVLDRAAWQDKTACGHVVIRRTGHDYRLPTCVDCIAALEGRGRA